MKTNARICYKFMSYLRPLRKGWKSIWFKIWFKK